MSDTVDQAIANTPSRNPIQEAIDSVRPGGSGIGSGSFIRYTDDDVEREAPFAIFVPKELTWEAAFAIQQILAQALAQIVATAEARKPAHGLTLVKGTLPTPKH